MFLKRVSLRSPRLGPSTEAGDEPVRPGWREPCLGGRPPPCSGFNYNVSCLLGNWMTLRLTLKLAQVKP